jgi:hypothetical protein
MAAAPASAMTTTTAAHAHGDDGHDVPVAQAPRLPDHPVTFEARLTGANMVPAPVSSTANAFARFTFDPKSSRLDYAVWVFGISADQITGVHVHRGGATETGGHAMDILTTGPTRFITFSGSGTLQPVDVANLLDGRLYLQLHTVQYPSGAARAQMALPVSATAGHDDHDDGHVTTTMPGVRPPSTGKGGLAAVAPASRGDSLLLAGALIAAVAIATLVAQRRRV